VHASPGPALPRPPPCGSLRNHHESNRDTFRRVDDRPGCPDRRLRVRSLGLIAPCGVAHRSRLGAATTRVSASVESSLVSAVPSTCLAAPRASRRAMRQTDFCLLTFFVRAPAPRRFPMRHALARRAIEGIAWFMSVRLASVGRTLSWCHRGGRCLPVAMRAVRTSGIPVASPTAVMSLARRAHP
jgi:hypothetical protein